MRHWAYRHGWSLPTISFWEEGCCCPKTCAHTLSDWTTGCEWEISRNEGRTQERVGNRTHYSRRLLNAILTMVICFSWNMLKVESTVWLSSWRRIPTGSTTWVCDWVVKSERRSPFKPQQYHINYTQTHPWMHMPEKDLLIGWKPLLIIAIIVFYIRFSSFRIHDCISSVGNNSERQISQVRRARTLDLIDGRAGRWACFED